MSAARIGRRSLLTGAGAAAAAATLSACAGPGTVALRLTAWGTSAERAAFGALIRAFEQANTGVRITPTWIDGPPTVDTLTAALTDAQPPDVVRVPFPAITALAGAKRIAPLSPYFSKNESLAYEPAFWGAVQVGDRPYAAPHAVDTASLLVPTSALPATGVPALATRPADAWTADAFLRVLAALRSAQPSRSPFVAGWENGAVSVWLQWLFAAGGRLLDTGLAASAFSSAAGQRAVELTATLFRRHLVPSDDRIGLPRDGLANWRGRTAVLAAVPASRLPEAKSAGFDWQAAPLPRDVREAGTLQGGGLAVGASTKHRDLAAQFVKSALAESAMRTFCSAACAVPTLKALSGAELHWIGRSGLSTLYAAQAATITTADVAQQTVAAAPEIAGVLVPRLDDAFTGAAAVDQTVEAIAAGIDAALA